MQRSVCVPKCQLPTCTYTVSQKNFPAFTCYNLDIHDLITIIFGTSVTEKVRNQTMLCFPTSPIWCFSIALRKRKPRRQRTGACNTVQLLQRSRLPFSWTMSPKAPNWTHWLQDSVSHSAAWEWVVSQKRLKKSSSDWLNSGNALIRPAKMQFSCFPVLPANVEAHVIWGGIVKRLLIAYFIGSISAKNIQIRSRESKL